MYNFIYEGYDLKKNILMFLYRRKCLYCYRELSLLVTLCNNYFIDYRTAVSPDVRRSPADCGTEHWNLWYLRLGMLGVGGVLLCDVYNILKLIYYFTYFSTVCFFSVRLSSLIQHFQQILWVLKFFLSPGLGG